MSYVSLYDACLWANKIEYNYYLEKLRNFSDKECLNKIKEIFKDEKIRLIEFNFSIVKPNSLNEINKDINKILNKDIDLFSFIFDKEYEKYIYLKDFEFYYPNYDLTNKKFEASILIHYDGFGPFVSKSLIFKTEDEKNKLLEKL